jgi:spore germination cell wall hydrolase CwlJ-like protein
MKPEDKPTFEALSTPQALALTLWAEAKNDGKNGQIAIGSVVLHRARLGYFGGHSVKNVCNVIFNSVHDLEYPSMLAIASDFYVHLRKRKDASLRQCMAIASMMIMGEIKPNIVASFYYREGTKEPKWVQDMDFVQKIGHHLFYKEKRDHEV